ncbi:MAG: hypothetical protein EU539_00925 [Promethearchaeota archaeon]|nr:MAG: hypothetical protein EU539_00925 [Candidatus Lokiarchaeota archaeon]
MTQNLSDLDILHGILTSLFVFISILVALRILSRYYEHKHKELITVGLAWMAISTPWWGNSFSFLLYMTMGLKLDLFTYLFIENAFAPLALIFWIYSFTTLAYPKLVKKLTILFSLICIPYEIFLITMLVINPEFIGTLVEPFDSQHTLVPNAFRVFAIFIVLLTGILFSKKSMSSEDKNIQWKGRFFLIGIISFTIGGLLDTVLTFTPLELIIVRALLISSAFEYYFGFFLPDRIANLLIKNK